MWEKCSELTTKSQKGEIIFIHFEVCVYGIFTYTLNGVPENDTTLKATVKIFLKIF